MIKIKFLLSLAFLMLLSLPAIAVEGMWQPRQLLDLAADLKAKGLQIPVENIAQLDKFPMTAMVSLGFCSASFVSDSGLIITNHHCAYGAIQYNSSTNKNLIENGFYAKTFADELPAGPGLYIYVTQDIKDVSQEIIGQLISLHGQERYDKYEAIETKMLAECEDKPVFRCSLRSFHGGLKYYLIKQLQIKDVRLVYAPANSIGKYGGDVDNWMWPRHTGDFSFFRAYVAKDGESAEYSKQNQPYHSKDFLKVNANGVKDGDFTMVLGYPGRTSRHKLAQEIENSVLWHYPMIIKNYSKYIELVEKEAQIRPEVGIKYAAKIASINNYLKNSQGMLDGFKNPQLIENKQQAEKDFFQWIINNDNKKAAHAWQMLKKLLDQKAQHRDRNFYIGQVKRSQLLAAAIKLHRLAIEKNKTDKERKSSYQKRNWDRIKNSLVKMDRRFDAKMDRILTEYALNQYAALSDEQRLAEFDKLFGIKGDAKDHKRIAKALDKLYKNTELGKKEKRLSWFQASQKAIENSKDSMLQLAVAMYPMNSKKEKHDEALTADLSEARMNYMQAYLDYAKNQRLPVYADANGTLRVTYGNVMGYQPKDGMKYLPFTTLKGILEKNTGIEPFNAPKKQLHAIKSHDYAPYEMASLNSVPVNFLSDLDITGGNSGSPTLDAKAQLVGLVFDGNYESINADWIFNKDLARSIHVDIRYILWIMDKIDHADRLLKEMKVKQ